MENIDASRLAHFSENLLKSINDTVKANYEKQLTRWKSLAEKAKAEGKSPPPRPRDPVEEQKSKGGPGGLFNGKIAPLVPYALRGVLWYQGEANSTPPLVVLPCQPCLSILIVADDEKRPVWTRPLLLLRLRLLLLLLLLLLNLLLSP